MRFLGLTITRTKAADMITHLPDSGRRGWWPFVREPFAGAWQRNLEAPRDTVLAYWTVWSCVTLIASDIGKLWINLVEESDDGICTPVESPAYSPVLRKPNHYQTRVKFFEYWIISKLVAGNTYVLKERDARGVVVALYVLDPSRVRPLVAPNGDVFYQLSRDDLAGLREAVTVPAREIIHDICVPLFHPLCGVSPIFACGLAAIQGLQIQQSSVKLFANGATLSGVLTAPGFISTEVAERLEKHWAANYVGAENVGKVAVLGDGLHFEAMTIRPVDAQLVEQLKWTAENICACFHVPGYMVGIGAAPPYTDIQSINLQYYAQALQNPIENIEVLLEEGLELRSGYGVEFDLDSLARMDTKTQMDIASTGVGRGVFTPNEARARFDLLPVRGGDTIYLQQQDTSIEALNRRDQAALAQPATPAQTPAVPALAVPSETPPADEVTATRALALWQELARAADLPVIDKAA